MNENKLTAAEMENRFAAICAREPASLDSEELASLAAAEAMDDGTTVSLSDYKKAKEYNGKILLRIPKELHAELAKSAEANGVSLNQYALYKLAK